jgi:hypothetical protein
MIIDSIPNSFFNKIQNNKNLDSLFYNCQNIKSIQAGSKLPKVDNMNSVLNLNSMFYNCVNLNSIPSDFFNLFLAGQININNCFNNCISLTTNIPGNFLWNNININWNMCESFFACKM